jgi:hypothetical protein
MLGGALLVLFFRSLDPHQILFNNDTPLGFLKEECNRMPTRFTGTWRDLCWLGGQAPTASPSVTMILLTLLSPVAYLKIYAPLTLLFLGFSAWLFFRQLPFSPMVCVLGGVAAGLNPHFFSIACWGQGNWNIAAGCAFLAMAALCAKSIPKVWERAVLAGLAVGMVVMEGYDMGAVLSVFIGLFIICHAFNDEAPMSRRVVNAVAGGTLVVLFAGVIAAHTMLTLVQTQVIGVSAMGQDVETKQTRWRSATQWSLPKLETLQVFVPGLFGYRLSGNIPHINRSSAYWGRIGQDMRLGDLGSDDPVVRSNMVSSLSLDATYLTPLNTPDRRSRTAPMFAVTKKAGMYWRYTGSGECAGTIVSLLALFGLANFFRKDSPCSKSERIAVGCWAAAALFSLLAAWGRYGFVYQLLYKLPYVSTIRNPIKFMHPFHIAWVVLAACGMEVLYRRYMRGPNTRTPWLPHHLQQWWARVAGFDRRWTIFMLVVAGASALSAVLLYANRGALIHYLEDQSFTYAVRSPTPPQIAAFSVQQACVFLVFLAAGMVALAAILSGAWSGSRIKWGWGCLAALMICDLARADMPWIRYYDYVEKYSLNSVTEFLSNKPWERRVIGKLAPRGPGSGINTLFNSLYFFWLQNDFAYHNIQSLDYPQWPHIPDLDRTYLQAFQLTGSAPATADLRPAARLWQLTNTRYILMGNGAAALLNKQADPIHQSFKMRGLFNMVPKPGITEVDEISDYTVQPDSKGQNGVIEYSRALPRAKLYANWRTPSNDAATLSLLTNMDFEPLNTVLIATNTPVPQPDSNSTADAGEVGITDYHPKYVRLEADARTPAVLLLNDRTGANWHVQIDGKESPVLRCNYIMRGAYLTSGHHIIEFRFKPSLTSLYVSVSAMVLEAILAGYLIVTRQPKETPSAPAATAPAPPPGRRKGNGKTKAG